MSAFLAAVRSGDFAALLQVLAPDVVLRFDLGPSLAPRPTLIGAEAVAGHIVSTAPRFISEASPVLVNGPPGLLFGRRDALISVLGFTVTGGRIAELDMVADLAKLRHLALRP